MAYSLFVTTIGLNKLQQANLNNSTLMLTDFGVGDGDLIPSQTTTALINERFRAQINRKSAENGVITLDLVMPNEVGGWFIKECGIYDSDGDLFASTNMPPTYKVSPSEGAAKSVFLRLYLSIQNSENITIATDESVIYATQDWTIEKIALIEIRSTPLTLTATTENVVTALGHTHQIADGAVTAGKLNQSAFTIQASSFFTASGTYTAPYKGVYKVTVIGGGGGGGCASSAGGAGGRSALLFNIVALNLSQKVTVTVGAGGYLRGRD